MRRRSPAPPPPHLRGGKHLAIVETLRGRIISGRYGAGALMPTVRELTAELSVSIPTVSRALAQLIDQGFITTDGRRGTHVVDHPPNRHRCALVLPEMPDGEGRYANLHWQALAAAARARSADPARGIALFHALNQHAELPEHRRLLAEIANGSVSGLVLCDPFQGGSWIDLGGRALPRIGGGPSRHPSHGAIHLSQHDFRTRAVALLRAQGRQRLAVIMDDSPGALAGAAALSATARACGMDCSDARILAAPLTASGWARHAAAALMGGAPGERPDALLVCDDNLAAAVEDGLDAAGIGGDQLTLAVHANFPHPPPTRRHAIRLGWDQREFLALAGAAISGWLDHGDALGERLLPVRTGDEVAP
jgi:DNA-binding transcriptional ArsR family regulator